VRLKDPKRRTTCEEYGERITITERVREKVATVGKGKIIVKCGGLHSLENMERREHRQEINLRKGALET